MSVCMLLSVVIINLYNYNCGGRRRRVTCPSKLARYSQAVTPCLTSLNPNYRWGMGSKSKPQPKNFFQHTQGGTKSSTRYLKPHLTIQQTSIWHCTVFQSQPLSKNHPTITSEDEGNLKTLSVLCYLDQ